MFCLCYAVEVACMWTVSYTHLDVYKRQVLNSAFATELSRLIADSRIDAWIYGHSHTNIDAEINGTKVVCNQMGYVFQNEHLANGFEPGKFLVL